MRDRVDILGVLVDRVAQKEALNRVKSFIDSQNSHIIVTPNAEMIVRAHQDEELKRILNSADLVIPDGTGVVLASKLLGDPLAERVTGIDLVKDLLEIGSKVGYNFYFLGGAPKVAQEAKTKVKEKYPNLNIRTHHGYLDRESETKVLEELENNRVDILLVGMGVPLQEKWLYKHLANLKVPVGIGVGGTFDILAGKKKRAPKVMQNFHLEWLYRLLQEPKRLARMSALPQFIYEVLQEKLKKLNKLK
ncbi:N-acetylmannosaminyltransferase [Orenia metallireducens]|uniref:N-acetylglucosaminyldiphosphoundecaprenol N-acetyl-beta-D-mannosaminyltransferase n=1 Tax=Orenia metallireducens TaxID=1413210 RepID=A0A1C0A5Q7_9FIRM|nr:WecB/TagA/CpsF family glycosyltransferase [Orenia metallireducens]OCL25475.1 N-acetylmannosaminyltransferase [Orenia metallireducens]